MTSASTVRRITSRASALKWRTKIQANSADHLDDIKYKNRNEVNKDKGKKSGESRIRNNAAEKLKGYCKGQIITTKELKEHGYNNSYAIKRITGVIIEKVGHGKYKMLIDIPS